MNWAWNVQLGYLGERDNKAGRRLLLVALGDNACEKGECWPAISTLARRCESSTKSVRRWLREFEDHQLLVISPRRNERGQTSNLYKLKLTQQVAEKALSPLDTESFHPGHGVQGPMTPEDRGPWSPSVPLTVNEPSVNLNHSEARASVFENCDDQIHDGVHLFQKDMNGVSSTRFPMYIDWKPSADELVMACQRAGLSLNLVPARHQLAKFTAHYADTGSIASTVAWHAKLADWLRRDSPSNHPAKERLDYAKFRRKTSARNLTASEARRFARQESEKQNGHSINGEWGGGH